VATGQEFPTLPISAGLLIGLPLLVAAATGFSMLWEMPALKGFNFQGGMVLIPEFVAMVLAISLYAAA
jgi:general L-amino acid transport system permease protein